MISVGVVGCGWAGRNAHLVPLRNLPEVRLAWVVDQDLALAESTAAEFGAARFASEMSDGLLGEVDAVVVASPTACHAEHALAALRAGKDVLVEKPMAASAEQAREMAKAANERNLVLMVGHCCRFMPAFVEMRRLFQSGQIGEVLHIQARRNVRIEAFKPWWSAERPGGFLMSWLGSHPIDLCLWLMMRRPARVYAEVSCHTAELRGDDAFSLVMWFDTGTLVSIDQSINSRDVEHDFLVIGSQGTLRVRDYVDLYQDGHPVKLDGPRSSHASYPRQMREFLSAIRERRRPAVSAEDGVATMDVLDACYRAAATHTVQDPLALKAAR